MHDIFCNDIQEPSNQHTKTWICVPTRIKQRWCKIHGKGCEFHITKALSMAKVSSKEFRKCWEMVHPMISGEELFCLCDKAFGVHGNLDGKVDFVKDILRRYKDMGEPVCACARACVCVCDCLACLCFVCVCLGVMVLRCVVMQTRYVLAVHASFVALTHSLTAR